MESSKKTQFIIPSDFVKIKYDRAYINDQIATEKPIKTFNNPNNEYTLVIKQKPERKNKSISVESDFFKTLNVKGPLTVKTENINDLRVDFSVQHVGYSNYDNFTSPKLTIDVDANILFDVVKKQNYVTEREAGPIENCPLKELILKGKWVSVTANGLDNLEKIKIDNSTPNDYQSHINHYYYNSRNICIADCPKLKEIDMSKILYLGADHFNLKNIPDNCVIKFNPDFCITYSVTSPLHTSGLKKVCPVYKSDRYSLETHKSIQEILNIDSYDEDKPICVSFKKFKEAINKTANKELESLYLQTKEQEQNQNNLIEESKKIERKIR